MIQADGTIKTYKMEDYNIDNILSGRTALFLANTLVEAKYYKAAATMRLQLKINQEPKRVDFGIRRDILIRCG